MFDTHIHTLPFSPDAHQTIDEVLEVAKSCPYGMCLTEHIDYGVSGNLIFEFDPEEYFKKYRLYRSDKLLLGVEMGLIPGELNHVKETVDKFPFDMVIGSIHVVNGYDIALKEYYHTHTKDEAYAKYLDAMIDMIRKYHEFDTLAHVDYVCRYCDYEDPELYVSDYKEALEAVFSFLIENNKCLELNTRRLNNKTAIDTLREIMRVYHHLGGRYITVGSDAHYSKNIAVNFKEAEKMINEFNFIPVYFKERKRIE